VVSGVALYKTSQGWEFLNEAALEKFIWENLEQLFNLTGLKQQYISKGEICDILAVDINRRLVILELKNTEDRYIIQQLTRYYANILEERPFQDQINYSLPIRLISVAPSYHRHNLIDKEHSKLSFELLNFSVIEEDQSFYFLLQKYGDTFFQKKYLIPYQPIETKFPIDIPEPPQLLIKWLGSCTKQEQEGFLKTRNKLLSSNHRMKEFSDGKSIQYGSGKTRLCAEILFQKSLQKPILFLWLPTPSTYSYSWREFKKIVVGRLRIWTNGETISHVGHVPEGFGKMKTKSEWAQVPPEKRPRMMENRSSKSRTPISIELYLGCQNNEEKPDFWDTLSELAIEKWLGK
jgi:RecB family endonuclease NucS